MKEPLKNTPTYDNKVLLIDENRLVLKSMHKTLELNGLNPQSAFNSEEAIQVAKDFKPDITIIGYHMSLANNLKSIYEFRKAINQTTEMHPIICIHSEESKITREKFKQAGANKLLRYPISPFQLLHTIDKLLTHKEPEAHN